MSDADIVTVRDSRWAVPSAAPDSDCLLVVRDLGCLGVAVAESELALALAVPEMAALEEGFGSGPVDVPLAGVETEGAEWEPGVSVVFFMLEWTADASALEEVDRDGMDPNDLLCFEESSFRPPDGHALVREWRRINSRGDGGGGFETPRGGGRRGQGPGAKPKSKPKAKGVRSVAGLAELIEGNFAGLERRLAAVEAASSVGLGAAPPETAASVLPAASGGSRVGGSNGVLGLGGGGGSNRLGGAAAFTRARELLGVGARGSEGVAGQGRRAARTQPAAPPAHRRGVAEDTVRTDGADQELGQVIEELAALLAGRRGEGATCGEAFGFRGDGYRDLGEYGANTGSLLEFAGRGVGGVGGHTHLERLIATRRRHPEVVIAANKEAIRESLGTLPGESWSHRLHAERHLLPHAGSFTTLKRMATILAAALDEGRVRGAAHQHAFLYHAYRVVESACLDGGHDMAWGWPLLGVDDPGGRPRGGLAPVEAATLAAFHRDRQTLDAARASAGGGGAARSSWEGGGREAAGSPGGGRGKGGKGGGGGGGQAGKASAVAATAAAAAKKDG